LGRASEIKLMDRAVACALLGWLKWQPIGF